MSEKKSMDDFFCTSDTAMAPEFRTQNLSAACPLKKALPDVAPYRTTLPTIMLFTVSKLSGIVFGG